MEFRFTGHQGAILQATSSRSPTIFEKCLIVGLSDSIESLLDFGATTISPASRSISGLVRCRTLPRRNPAVSGTATIPLKAVSAQLSRGLPIPWASIFGILRLIKMELDRIVMNFNRMVL